jgi:O-antigen/teichoic acid export membrane protein
LKKNFKNSLDYIFFFIGSFFALLCNLFLGYFSIEDLGLFNKSYAIFIVLGHLFLFSAHENIVKNLQITNNRVKYLTSIFFVATICCFLSIFFLTLFNLIINNNNLFNKVNFIFLIFSIPFFIINKVFFAVLNADKNFHLYFFLNCLRPIIIFFSLLILFYSEISITNVFIISEIIIILINICIYQKFKIEVKINNLDFKFIKKILRFNFLSLPHSLLSYSFLRIDIIILSFFISLEDLGYYSLASMIIEGIYQLLTMMRDRLNPDIAIKLHLKSFRLNLYYKKILINVILFLLISTFTYFIFFPMFSYLSSYEYFLSREIFLIISLGLFLFSISSPLEYIFLMNNKPHYQSIYIIFGNLLNFILNIILINKFGVYGAAYATSISFMFLSIIIFNYASKISR